MLKIVFFGTPDYVIPVLESLHKSFRSGSETCISAVVTQEPKPVGRKKVLSYSAVDNWAHRRNITILFDPIDLIKNNVQADIGILASYGKIIPKEVIDHFKHGIINIHPSLLPKFRGSSPVQAIIITNSHCGVTFMKLDEYLDHGPIISQSKDTVLEHDNTKTLRERLFLKSAEILPNLILAYIKGKITPKPQEHQLVSFTRQLRKEDGFIPPRIFSLALKAKICKDHWEIGFIKDDNSPFSLQPDAYNLERFIRAMNPWPIAWTYIRESSRQVRLRIFSAQTRKDSDNVPQLIPITVQLEGGKQITWKQLQEGHPGIKFV